MQHAATTSTWQGSVFLHVPPTRSPITRAPYASAIRATRQLTWSGETAQTSMNVSPTPVKMKAPVSTWRVNFHACVSNIGMAHSARHALCLDVQTAVHSQIRTELFAQTVMKGLASRMTRLVVSYRTRERASLCMCNSPVYMRLIPPH